MEALGSLSMVPLPHWWRIPRAFPVCPILQGGAVRNELFKVLDAEEDMLLKEGLPTNEGRRASR